MVAAWLYQAGAAQRGAAPIALTGAMWREKSAKPVGAMGAMANETR